MIKLFENFNKKYDSKKKTANINTIYTKVFLFINDIINKDIESVKSDNITNILNLYIKTKITKSKPTHTYPFQLRFHVDRIEFYFVIEEYKILEKYLSSVFSKYLLSYADNTYSKVDSFIITELTKEISNEINFSKEDFEIFKEAERFGL